MKSQSILRSSRPASRSNSLSVLRATCGILLFAAGAGCAAPVSSSGDGASAGAESQAFTRTIVRVNADRTRTITTEPIAPLILGPSGVRPLGVCPNNHPSGCGTGSIDPGCAGADMWMWDQANWTGNELCVIGLVDALYDGADTLDLSTVTRTNICIYLPFDHGAECFGLSWAGAVRSFWAGQQGGSFDQDLNISPPGSGCLVSFNPWEQGNMPCTEPDTLWLFVL